MTPDKLRAAGWLVVHAEGGWVAYRKGNPLLVYGMSDGSVVYAVPEETRATVVRGFRPAPNN